MPRLILIQIKVRILSLRSESRDLSQYCDFNLRILTQTLRSQKDFPRVVLILKPHSQVGLQYDLNDLQALKLCHQIVLEQLSSKTPSPLSYWPCQYWLLAIIVDARYCFRVIPVGARASAVMDVRFLHQPSAEHSAMMPLTTSDVPLPGAEGATPYVSVGDEAFPLRRDVARPFPGHNLKPEQRIFNYRLSRAWRMVQCAFVILASQWRLYRRVFGVSPEVAEVVVKATCILYNFIHFHSADEEDLSTALCTEPSAGMQGITHVGSKTFREAMAVREKFVTYFSSAGEVLATYSCLIVPATI